MARIILNLPWLYVLLRFLDPLPWPWPVECLVAVVLAVAAQYLFFCRLSSGSVFSPEFPKPLIIAFNLVFGGTVLLAIFQIALDLASLVCAAVTGHFPAVPPELRYAIGILAFLLAAYGVAQAVRVPPLKDVEVKIAGLDRAFDGYRFVQLTDLHLSRLFTRRWAEAVVERTNALGADMVLMTGDLIDGDLAHRRNDVAPIAGLKARDGVYAIPGNHEYFFDYGEWMEEYRRLGMRPLLNTHAVIRRGQAALVIAGVTDRSAGGRGEPRPDLGAALGGAPQGAPVVLLDHQPKMAPEAEKAGVALQLSGHTHGGMVVGLASLVARGNNGFVSGLYRVGRLQLYVNNGTGLWPGFALRLGKPSELTRFTLRRA